jgi:hypothetical protein
MEIFVSRCFGMLFCSFKTMFFLIMQFCFEYVCSAHMQAGRVAFGFSCTLHDLIPTSTLSTNYNIFSDTVAMYSRLDHARCIFCFFSHISMQPETHRSTSPINPTDDARNNTPLFLRKSPDHADNTPHQ